MYENVLYGALGATGAGLVAWKALFPWLGDDLKFLRAAGPVKRMADRDVENNYFMIEKFEDKVKLHPYKPCIIYEGNVFSYEFVDQQAAKVANIVKKWNLSENDSVALFFSNSPEYIWTLLGLMKLGICGGLINCNLQGKALIHSINASTPKAVIVGEGQELLSTIKECLDALDCQEIYVQGAKTGTLPSHLNNFDELMSRTLPTPIDKRVRSHLTIMSTLCYIYTSGTTGLPKPVYILQHKAMNISKLITLFNGNTNDVFYIFLPFYHTSGQMSWLGAIDVGATILLRKKFSASNFWNDINLFNVTVVQYIGELCRYLLSQPWHPLETSHKLRFLFGNGLRKDIWEQFQKRFKIPNIVEFFGATEGTGFTCQLSNKAGAVGRLSPLIKKLVPTGMRIVKCDYDTAQPLRDKNGRCIDVGGGETGLLIAFIPPESRVKPLYKAPKEATEKKIIANAFEDGDMFFNYGDTVYLDKNYFIYFQDRLGDTFRWKGENVSTTEVANILTDVDFINDANVYGVTVPGHDGRAGMAALTLTDLKDLNTNQLKTLYSHCERQLPKYASPLFLRILEKPELTSTFKQRKVELVKDAYNPTVISDPLYFRDDNQKTYLPITIDTLSSIMSKSKL